MGHLGTDDKVFIKYYQSHIFTVDSGNIFRKEEPRPEKLELLAMRSKRDPRAPHFLLEATKVEILDADENFQGLRRSMKELRTERHEIQDELDSGYNRVTIEAALKGIERSRQSRRAYLLDRGLKNLRETHFLGETSETSLVMPWDIVRPDLAEILYPENGDLGYPQVALERLIAHCNGAAPSIELELFASPRPHLGHARERYTPEDDQLLVSL